ncbi:MAG: glycosyltransferase family 4 protein [Taibaiella sp.]|nr:glycosyltransferase family 4 protein [Taibaiella sp.]
MPDTLLSVNYLLLAIILLACMFVYFRLALRFRIIDKPNERSSHFRPTIRGGGILFPVVVLLYFLLNSFQYPWFALAVLVSGAVSFIDDIRGLPRLLRFGVHALAACLILFEAGAFTLPVLLVIPAFIFIVGVINAFNFMDGINGITGFYTLAVLLPLMLTETDLANLELQAFICVALLVFLLFNARKKAKCFAGDVGSVSIAVIVLFLLVQRIVVTNDYKYLGFLSIYLVETGLTIIQRWRMGERIFEAHRRHMYQVMSNEMGWPHLLVAAIYALLQLGINMLLVNSDPGVIGLVILFAGLVLAYIPIKIVLLKMVSVKTS